jgi:hypothetical protein
MTFIMNIRKYECVDYLKENLQNEGKINVQVLQTRAQIKRQYCKICDKSKRCKPVCVRITAK